MLGILTFLGTQSHGACLQAYALKHRISELGYEVELINYECAEIKKSMDKRKPSNAKSLKSFLGALKRYPYIKKRYKKFEDYRKEKLGVESLSSNIDWNDYDGIVVGSDQIWNLELTGNDYNFFLENVKDDKKKLTYAASMGVEAFPLENEDKCLKLVSKFSTVNVREQQLCTYLNEKLPNKKIDNVIDPTLLLSPEVWEAESPKEPIKKGRYMLVHFPANGKENWDEIYKLAKEKGLEIVFITNQIVKKKDCECLYSVSPIEYINYIKNAEIVVTGSFHTLCFSLIFNRQFYCTVASIANRNSRLVSLLSLVGCSDRMLLERNDKNIDFETVNGILDDERSRCLGILKSMCEKIYQ